MTQKSILLFKYGGNAMVDNELRKNVLMNIITLSKKGFNVIISHGGGPFIKDILGKVNIRSEFIDGQRVTSPEAFEYIEMVLKGRVNSELVNTLNVMGRRAVGISGRDGKTVIAVKREHKTIIEGEETLTDLGRVGNVAKVNKELIISLLMNDFIPVIACIAADEKGTGYNINGDTFAGNLAGSLGVEQFIVLTDVDGLLRDKNDPSSIIKTVSLSELQGLKARGIIQGGMIPKTEACEYAVKNGAASARIINGTKPEQIAKLYESGPGTVITK